jgi:proline dehydrogenase
MEATSSPLKIANQYIDFGNTEIAFSHLSDSELKKTGWLFKMMSKAWLVKFGAPIGLWAVEKGIPFAETVVKSTIFKQFCAGTTLLGCKPAIEHLWKFNTLTVLDYGAEAKESELDFNHSMNEYIRAIEYASRSKSIPVVTIKITGLARFDLLERIQSAAELTKEERKEYRNALKRLDSICYKAAEKDLTIYIDAEESWIQDAIDHLTWLMMKRYNKKKVVVFNTFQLYRNDRLQFLMESYDRARREGFYLGAKLVRGAYMTKERARAEAMDYQSPINPSKQATDDCFDTALRFCIDHYETMSSCNASHNAESALLQVELMEKKKIAHDHPNLMFSQLYGMSDNLTFNLAKAGYRVGKYSPYGQVRDVIPYLIRRAQENTAVTGDVGREYGLVLKELKRRKL